jgi:hypothetical protein
MILTVDTSLSQGLKADDQELRVYDFITKPSSTANSPSAEKPGEVSSGESQRPQSVEVSLEGKSRQPDVVSKLPLRLAMLLTPSTMTTSDNDTMVVEGATLQETMLTNFEWLVKGHSKVYHQLQKLEL